MKKFLLFFLLILFVLSACASQTPTETIPSASVSVDGGSYLNATSSELNTMLANKDFVFVNVHIPFAGNIAGTDLSIAYDQLEQNLTKLPTDKNTKIVLYCRSGRMSAIAAETLVKLGYTNIWNLDGGMVAWEQAGHEILK